MSAQQSVIPMAVRPMEFQELSLPPELEEKLKAPLPPEAITSNERNPHLSSIKPAFVIERMNDVFGIGGYHTTNKTIHYEKVERTFKKGQPGEYKRDQFIGTVHGTLEIAKYNIHLENYGGSENDDLGDALKGAATDAFTKMCSYLGVGLEVYKGKHDKPKESDIPACPACKKVGAIIKGKEEFGGGWLCFGKKGGCGAKFTDAEMEQIKSGKVETPKPPQSAAKTNGGTKAAPVDGSKFTICAKVTKKWVEDRKAQGLDSVLWLQVGEFNCATKQPDMWAALNHIKVGSTATLLVSKFEGKDGPIHQIHKVIPNAPEGGHQ